MKPTLSLYLDESGRVNWPKDTEEDLASLRCIIAGPLIEPRSIHRVAEFNSELRTTLSQWLGKKIAWVHMTDVMSCEGSYSKLTEDKAQRVADTTIDFLLREEIRLVGAANNFASLERRRGRRLSPYLHTLESVLKQADFICRPRGLQFRATVAGRNGVGQDQLVNFINRTRYQTQMGENEVPLIKTHIDSLVEGILIGEPRHNAYLQLADGVTWFLQRGDSRHLDRLKRLWLIEPAEASTTSGLEQPEQTRNATPESRRAEGWSV